jgi:hypothetical protein
MVSRLVLPDEAGHKAIGAAKLGEPHKIAVSQMGLYKTGLPQIRWDPMAECTTRVRCDPLTGTLLDGAGAHWLTEARSCASMEVAGVPKSDGWRRTMSQAVLSPTQAEVNLARLDDLIATLKDRNSEQVDLLVEHLHSARIYSLGAMPKEYAAALRDARDAAGRVKGKELRQTLQGVIDYLLTELSHVYPPHETERRHHTHLKPHGPAPPGVRSHLWDFFSGWDISFGVFYPKRHIVAIFPSFGVAKQAEAALGNAGFSEQEILAIAAEEMLQFLDELRLHTGLWGMLMAPLSRIFGTEEVFVDNDIRRAREGAGFLAIYSPEDAESEPIRQLLDPFGPIAMQRYLALGIQSLI